MLGTQTGIRAPQPACCLITAGAPRHKLPPNNLNQTLLHHPPSEVARTDRGHVNGRRGLVHDEDAGLPHKGTRQAEELPLALAEVLPAFRDDGIWNHPPGGAAGCLILCSFVRGGVATPRSFSGVHVCRESNRGLPHAEPVLQPAETLPWQTLRSRQQRGSGWGCQEMWVQGICWGA